jgi:hypothetical protein
MEDPKGGEITPSSFHVLTSCKDATAPTEHCWKITALQSVEKHQKLMKAEQGYTYRTGGPNRRPPVTVNRSVSRGYRCLPSKFKFSNLTASHSVTHRFTDRFGPVTDRLGR